MTHPAVGESIAFDDRIDPWRAAALHATLDLEGPPPNRARRSRRSGTGSIFSKRCRRAGLGATVIRPRAATRSFPISASPGACGRAGVLNFMSRCRSARTP